MPDTDPPRLSVVLPCYNEQEVLPETIRRVTAACEAEGLSFEIVLVNDGSRDGTWPLMRELSTRDPRIVAVNLSRNHGHQLALSAGLWACRGERIMIMDADLQDPPELLPKMMEAIDRGADVAYAQRRTRFGDAPLKRLFCAVYYRLLRRLAERPAPLDTGDFRMITRRARDILVHMPERRRYIRGMVSWIGFRQEPVPYDRDARFAGETKYPIRKLIALAIDGTISSSVKPLAFAAGLGVAALTLGVLLTAYALVSWVAVGSTPQGWTSLMIVTVFLGGLQLLTLGILGEYVGRLYEQARARPMFLIDEILREGRVERPSP
jgi:glycosyltransferase involved in cell wall biosynthesis